MGLAASQARFLAITSRKAYCEFQSMQIAQDKLSVTRELSDISADYQNALNQTKLVWDYDGTGQNPYNLSYGVLMTPTDLNNYNPYLITTRTGAVVLNSQLAEAAKTISETGTSVAPSEAGYHAFIDALANNGAIPKSTAESIKNNLTYSEKAGYGGESLNKNGAYANNIIGLTYRTQDKKISINNITSTDASAEGAFKLQIDGSFVKSDTAKDLTLADLLTKNVVYMYTQPKNGHNENDTTLQNCIYNATTGTGLWAQITKALDEILAVDLAAQNALNMAKELVQAEFLGSEKNGDWSKRSTENALNNAVNAANNNNSYGYGATNGNRQGDTIAINLSNLVSSYLTYFELCYNGFESDYQVDTYLDNCYFVTDDPYYNYVMKDESAIDSVTVMQADFYMQLYNNICINGWTRNDNVEDDTYLENALKNGTYFITSLNGDGYFYQGRYNEEDCIVEVIDDDAIAQAEAEFTSKKAKLTYKEEQLDMEMKNLDTEISSLTTEYDSVKNLISKNVEKVFTMFQ